VIPVGFDLETYPFAPGRQAPRIVCGQTWTPHDDGDPFDLFKRADCVRTSAELLEDEEVLLVGCNLAFDLACLCEEDPAFFELVFAALEAGRIWDVGLFDLLLDISLGRFAEAGTPSLAALVKKYLDRDRSEEKKSEASPRGKYRDLEAVPLERWPKGAVDYCRDDARDPILIFEKQLAIAEEAGGLPPLFVETCRHDFAFKLLSSWGVRTDGKTVAELRARLEATLAAATPALVEAGILRKDGSEYQLETKSRVRAVLGEGAPLTDTGRKKLAEGEELSEAQILKYTRTASEVLDAAAGVDPALDLWASVKADRKELSDFVPRLALGATLPICGRVNATVSSFRTSMSGPNLQQMPRRSGVRECFVPRPGYVFLACDYHVAELCSLAQVLLDLFSFSAMAEELRAGRDLHVVFAAELLAASYDETLRRYKAGDEEAKDGRTLAKPFNFGIPGGLGVARMIEFARDYVRRPDGSFPAFVELFTPEYMKERKELWLERFPEMRRYFDLVGGWASSGSFTHRHPRTGFLRGGVGYCDGCNQGFQHLTAAGAKDAAFDVARECYTDRKSALFGSRPVLFIHDELILEAPEDPTRLTAAAKRLESVMCAAMARYTPDIPVRADAAAMRRWYKGADPVYVNDLLVPWEPS